MIQGYLISLDPSVWETLFVQNNSIYTVGVYGLCADIHFRSDLWGFLRGPRKVGRGLQLGHAAMSTTALFQVSSPMQTYRIMQKYEDACPYLRRPADYMHTKQRPAFHEILADLSARSDRLNWRLGCMHELHDLGPGKLAVQGNPTHFPCSLPFDSP